MYTLSAPIDAFGRFEVRHVIDSAGDPVARMTIPTASDPESISGDSATLTPYSGYAGPRWIAFVRHLGIIPIRGRYQEEIKGHPAYILAAIDQEA